MKCIAGVFLCAATGIAQALLVPAANQSVGTAIAETPYVANSTAHAASQPGAARSVTPAYKPLTASERWKQFTHDNFTGQGVYLRSVKTAVFEEIHGRPANWPATLEGFGERLGSAYARNVTQAGITDAMAAALRHDTRYLPCACEGKAARLRYSIRMTVFTRNQDGDTVFDVSRFAGLYGGALASTSWHPHRLGAGVASARLTGFGVGTALLTNIAREFSPEFHRLLRFRQ